MLGVEDWAEIRRLSRSDGLSIKEIARQMGVARNTVRTALRSEVPPAYQRETKGSIVDPFEPEIRRLLMATLRMPATVIAERIGWTRSLTVLKERVRELRPLLPCGFRLLDYFVNGWERVPDNCSVMRSSSRKGAVRVNIGAMPPRLWETVPTPVLLAPKLDSEPCHTIFERWTGAFPNQRSSVAHCLSARNSRRPMLSWDSRAQAPLISYIASSA